MIIFYFIINLLNSLSILYIVYILILLLKKLFEFRVLENKNVKFVLTKTQLLIIWISLGIIFNNIFT